jgi:hypothetical protein
LPLFLCFRVAVLRFFVELRDVRPPEAFLRFDVLCVVRFFLELDDFFAIRHLLCCTNWYHG